MSWLLAGNHKKQEKYKAGKSTIKGGIKYETET